MGGMGAENFLPSIEHFESRSARLGIARNPQASAGMASSNAFCDAARSASHGAATAETRSAGRANSISSFARLIEGLLRKRRNPLSANDREAAGYSGSDKAVKL